MKKKVWWKQVIFISGFDPSSSGRSKRKCKMPIFFILEGETADPIKALNSN